MRYTCQLLFLIFSWFFMTSCTEEEPWFGQEDTFIKYYGGGDEQVAKDLVGDGEGLYLLGQTNSYNEDTSQILLIRTDKAGNELWSKLFRGEGFANAVSLCLTDNDQLFLLGTTASTQGGLDESADNLLMLLDKNGDVVWETVFGEPTEHEGPKGMTISNQVINIFGTTTQLEPNKENNRPRDYFIAQLDKGTGDQLQYKVKGFPGDDIVYAIYNNKLENSFIIFGNTSFSLGGEAGTNIFATRLPDLNKPGTPITIGGNFDDQFNTMISIDSNNFSILGTTLVDEEATEVFIEKIRLSQNTDNGTTELKSIDSMGIGALSNATPNDMILSNGGDYVVFGEMPNENSIDLFLHKVNRITGRETGAPTFFGSSGDDRAAGLLEDSDGYMYVLATVEFLNENSVISLMRVKF